MNIRKGLIIASMAMASTMAMGQGNMHLDKPTFFPKLFGLNKGLTIGIMGGGMESMDYGAVGMNVIAYGVYADFMGCPGERVEQSDGEALKTTSVWSSHVGYRIPFHQYKDGSMSLIPMVGYLSKSKTTSHPSSQETLTATHENSGSLDYGAALMFQRENGDYGAYNLLVGCTRHSAWVSLGYTFPRVGKGLALDGTDTQGDADKRKANNAVAIGVIGGVMDRFSYGAMGLNFTVKGVYADFMWWPRTHKNDARIALWEDHSVFACHVGYQIPLIKHRLGSIRLIPLVGYAKVKIGITDGNNWSVDENGINNSFRVTETIGGFDYGSALAFNFNSGRKGAMGYNVYLSYTSYTAWVGLGMEIPLP